MIDRKSRPRRRWTRWLVDVLIVVAVIGAIKLWQERDLLAPDGETAPDFEVQMIDGRTLALDELEGKPVLLHFWATWCGVCRREFGMLNRLHERLDGKAHVVTVAVNSGDAATVRAFAAERGLDFPIALGTEELASRYRVSSYPTNYYLNDALELRGRSVGMSTGLGIRWRLWWYGR